MIILHCLIALSWNNQCSLFPYFIIFFHVAFLQTFPKTDLLLDNESQGSGVFLPELDEPEYCNAQNSALWELHALRVRLALFLFIFYVYECFTYFPPLGIIARVLELPCKFLFSSIHWWCLWLLLGLCSELLLAALGDHMVLGIQTRPFTCTIYS